MTKAFFKAEENEQRQVWKRGAFHVFYGYEKSGLMLHEPLHLILIT